MRSSSRWMFGALVVLALALIVPWAIAQANQGMGQGQMGQGMGQHMGQGQAMGPQNMGQQQMGQQQMGQGMGQGQMGQGMHYDPSTVVTVKGTVQEVQQETAPAGHQQMGGMGVHLVLKTDKETETILVGPQGFLTQKNFSFSNGDKIEVTGSKVKYGDTEAIIAREIKKGDQTLTLRNEQGIPLWSGRGRQ
jgi:hypothetical protein